MGGLMTGCANFIIGHARLRSCSVCCVDDSADIKDVRFVINYDMPGCCEDYVSTFPPAPLIPALSRILRAA